MNETLAKQVHDQTKDIMLLSQGIMLLLDDGSVLIIQLQENGMVDLMSGFWTIEKRTVN